MTDIKNLPECPVETTLKLIGNKWKVLIIRDLLTGTKRFNELMKSLDGISQKVLTSNLRSMENDGIDVYKRQVPFCPRGSTSTVFINNVQIVNAITNIIPKINNLFSFFFIFPRPFLFSFAIMLIQK